MWMPLVLSILPKTLLKWATPQSKSSIKFKTKLNSNNYYKKVLNKGIDKNFKNILKSLITTTTTTTATTRQKELNSIVPSAQQKENSIFIHLEIFFLIFIYFFGKFNKIIIKPAFAFFLIEINFLEFGKNQHFLGLTVINNLIFLMNDFRFKTFNRSILFKIKCFNKTATTRKPKKFLSKKILKTKTNFIKNKNKNNYFINNTNINNYNNQTFNLITIEFFKNLSSFLINISNKKQTYNQNQKNLNFLLISLKNKFCTYNNNNNNNSNNNNSNNNNNRSKTSKVFLLYIPRDPRLRILIISKNSIQIESESELKITEDLCNHGELNGGSGEFLLNRPQQSVKAFEEKQQIQSSEESEESAVQKLVHYNYCDKLRVPCIAPRLETIKRNLLDIFYQSFGKDLKNSNAKNLLRTIATGILF